MSMNRYRVYGGIARLGPGQMMLLSAAQISARAHVLELPEGYDPRAKDARPAEVKTKAGVEFKRGEVIGLPDALPLLVGIIEPVEPPKSKNDEKAADQALAVRDPKAHAKKRAAAVATKKPQPADSNKK
jgi:hypothetical protein